MKSIAYAGLAVVTAWACVSAPQARVDTPDVAPSRGTLAIEERIAFHRAALEQDDALYPAWIELGHAFLDRARITKAIDDVYAAEQAIERGLGIQPTFEGYIAQAALANFRHRFEEALEPLDRARQSWPGHPIVMAMTVEALVSLGRLHEAEECIVGEDFHALAARGRVHVEAGRIDEGVEAYAGAANAAEVAGVDELAGWAHVRAAATLMDAGRHDSAWPALERALELVPEDRDLRFHLAEFHELQGRLDEALSEYLLLLEESSDPTVLAAISEVARTLGDPRAAAWFLQARRAFEHSVERGEVYSLGALARLLLAADVDLDVALTAARRNAQLDRGRSARELVQEIQQRVPSGVRD